MAGVVRKMRREWEEKDPVLGLDEFGIERNTNRLKIGDGVTQWSKLPFITADAPHAVVDLDGGTP